MGKKDKRIDLLLALGVNIIFLIIYICFFVPIQESNDDLAMSFLVEGLYGERSGYMIFENILWGKFLVGLYQIMPQIKWYNVMSYVLIFSSFLELSYAFIRMQGRKIGLAVSTIMLMICGHQTYILFQFSRVTAIGAVGGMIMLFFALEYAEDKHEKILCIIAGALLTLWASMMRFEMFALCVVLVGAPLAIYRLIQILRLKAEDTKKQIITYLSVFGTVGILSLALYLVNWAAYYTDEQWAAYMEYNKVRADLWDTGFPDYDTNKELYESLDISESDFIYYLCWNMDEEVLTVDTLKTLQAAKTERMFSLTEFLSMFPKDFIPLTVFTLFLVTSIIAVALNKKNIYFALFGFWGVMAFEAMFYWMGRYGFPRVDSGMWMAAFLVVVYGMSKDLAAIQDKAGRWGFAAVAVTMVFNTTYLYGYTHIQLGKVGSTKTVYQEIMQDKEHLYIMLERAPQLYYAYDFWEPCQEGDLTNVYNAFGWEYNVEAKHEILENYGIENIYRDSIDNEAVYFVGGEYSPMLEQYIRENYNLDIGLYPIKEIMGQYVWSIKTYE